MTALTKQDIEVLDKIANEKHYKDWDDFLNINGTSNYHDLIEYATILSRQATEKNCHKAAEETIKKVIKENTLLLEPEQFKLGFEDGKKAETARCLKEIEKAKQEHNPEQADDIWNFTKGWNAALEEMKKCLEAKE